MKHFKLMKGVLACLLSLVLVATSITPTNEISAEEQTTTAAKPTPVSSGVYNPEKDAITGLPNGTAIYVLKNEKGNTIKKGAKYVEADGEAIDVSTLAKSTAKDLYLYCCSKNFEDEAKSINANLVIKGQAAKKITGVIDYTQADDKDSSEVLSIKAVDKNKKDIANPTAIWYDEESGTWKDQGDFKGSNLKAVLANGGATLQVKMLGTSTAPYVRTSKAIKVKIAKQGKAPKLTLDVKKETLSIKNGMDFGIATKTGDEYTAPTEWFTVLPVLKDAKTKTAADSIVSTSNFLPLDKKDKDAKNAKGSAADSKVSYTQYKYKNIALTEVLAKLELLDEYEDGKEVYLAVRTSATNKKPASAITYATITGQTEAPIIITEAKVDGQYVVATASEFDKKGLAISSIVNYPGESGSGLATTGFWNTFAVNETAGSGADTNSGNYEFAVVKYGDVKGAFSGSGANIDWSTVAWKKLDTKTKITSKLSTKYALTGKASTKVELKAKSVAVDTNSTEDATVELFGENAFDAASDSNKQGLADSDTMILVRRAGTKGKTADDSITASAFAMLRVIKVGKTYYLITNKCVGEEANKYTVQFYKYTTSGSGGFVLDTKSTKVTGWAKKSTSVSGVELSSLDGAMYSTSGLPTGVTNPGGVSIANGTVGFTMGNDDTTVSLAIKEYANVTIVAKYSGAVGSGSGQLNITGAPEVTVKTVTEGKEGTATTPTVFVGDTITVDISKESGWTYTVTNPANVTVNNGTDKITVTYVVTSAKETTINIPIVIAKASS